MGIFASQIWLTLIALAFTAQGGLILMSYRLGFQPIVAEMEGKPLPASLTTYRGLGWIFLLCGLGLLALQLFDIWRMMQIN